jgi:non-heme chloroperoxidase
MRFYHIRGGGIRLHVEETGNLYGRTILFIHGLSQCRLCWRNQLFSNLTKEFRMVALDLRGHGLFGKPRGGYGNSSLWADDIQAVMKTLELHRPILVAWSYAGLVVCDYIRVYGDKQIAGVNLVSVATTIGTKKASGYSGAERKAISAGFVCDNAEKCNLALQTFVQLCFSRPLSPQDYYFILGYNTIVPPYVRSGLMSQKTSNEDVLVKISKPVLITHGAEDR